MLLEASAEFGVDLSVSYLVGDKAADIECGRRAGAADWILQRRHLRCTTDLLVCRLRRRHLLP
jgi:histidinol phosphatase-like enzyme